MLTRELQSRNLDTYVKDGSLYIFKAPPLQQCTGKSCVTLEILRPDPDNPRAWYKEMHPQTRLRSFRPSLDLGLVDFGYLDLDDFRRDLPSTDVLMGRVLDIFEISRPEDSVSVITARDDGAYKTIETAENRAWRRAFSPVDITIRNLTERFHPDAQWNILVACLRVPGMVELNNPGLLFLHAHIYLTGEACTSRPFRTLRRLVTKPRREQVAHYGLPARELFVRILEKIPAQTLRGHALLAFVDRLRRADRCRLKTITHLPQLNRALIGILIDEQMFSAVNFRFLEELSVFPEGEDQQEILMMLHELLRLAEISGRRLPVLRTLWQMNQLHNELLDEMRLRKFLDLPIPPVPFQGIPGKLIPLGSADAIFRHGRVQGNCVVSLIPSISQGRRFLYEYRVGSVCSEEVGTVEVKRTAKGRWKLSKVLAAHNRKACPEAEKMVRVWFIDNHMLHPFLMDSPEVNSAMDLRLDT